MKARVILVVLAFAVAGIVVPAGAQTDAEQPAKAEQLRQQFLEERAEAVAQILEKRAELTRLSAQKEPDVKEVQKLVKEIAELRTGFWQKCAEYREAMAAVGKPAVPPAPGVRPERRGFAPRHRYDAGPGQGWGFGPGRGLPRGGRVWRYQDAPGRKPAGPWAGRGAGVGRRGRFGPHAAPMVRGWGMRPGGRGPFSTDRDSDGICDYWQGLVSPPAEAVGEPAE